MQEIGQGGVSEAEGLRKLLWASRTDGARTAPACTAAREGWRREVTGPGREWEGTPLPANRGLPGELAQHPDAEILLWLQTRAARRAAEQPHFAKVRAVRTAPPCYNYGRTRSDLVGVGGARIT